MMMERRRMMFSGGESPYAPGQLIVVHQGGYGTSISRDYGNTWEKLPISNDVLNRVAVSKGGKFIAVPGYYNGLRYSDDYGVTFRPLGYGWGVSVRMSQDGKHLIVWSYNSNHVTYMDVEKMEKRTMSYHDASSVRGCFFYEEDHILVATDRNKVNLSSRYLQHRGLQKTLNFTLDVLAGYDTENDSGFYGFRGTGGSVEVNYAESSSIMNLGKRLRYFTYSTNAVNGESSLDGSVMLIARFERRPWLFTNSGWTYEEVKSLPAGDYTSHVDISHDGSVMVYTKQNEIYMSRDRGRHFSKLNTMPSRNTIDCIGISK